MDVGCEIWDAGWIWDVRSEMQDMRFGLQDAGCEMWDAGWMQNVRFGLQDVRFGLQDGCGM